MRKLKISFGLFVAALLLAAAASATEFDRSCSVTGGSSQRLSAVLTACGYGGGLNLKELTVRNPDSAANDLYVGQSGVDSTTGYKLSPGQSHTWRSSGGTDVIASTDKYLWVSSTQNVDLTVRAQ